MNFFSRGRAALPEPPIDSLEVVRLHSVQLERARRQRDLAIAAARREASHTQKEIAEAAGLSISRIKQVPQSDLVASPLRSAVTDVDILSELANEDSDPTDERVLHLDDIAHLVRQWPSERDFIAENAHREGWWDLVRSVNDADSVPWKLSYSPRTKELWAVRREPDLTDADRNPTKGWPHGPCVLLGRVPSWKVVESCIEKPFIHVGRRPGGLAWVYGRVQLINAVAEALVSDYRMTDLRGSLTSHLDAISSEEHRPGHSPL